LRILRKCPAKVSADLPPLTKHLVLADSAGSNPVVNMDERIAADSNSRTTVTHSVLGLKRPTNSVTAGLTPAARPPSLQPKSGPGYGAGSPASLPSDCEADRGTESCDDAQASALPCAQTQSLELDDFAIRQIRDVFELLNSWDLQ
jgi:hypothetical protein